MSNSPPQIKERLSKLSKEKLTKLRELLEKEKARRYKK
jgi:hypothetical protein